MNLKEFTEKTINDVISGIQSAECYSKDGALYTQKIGIDVAVVVAEKDGKKGEADLRVWGILSADGEISKESTNSSVSRVKFEVGINADVFDRKSVNVYHPTNAGFNKGR